MKVNNLMKGIMAVSLLIFTASCEEENESLQGGNSGNNTQTTDTHEAVDLGLSVKWATCNVGATSPEDYGGYYAWGETEEKRGSTWDNYKYWTDSDGDGYLNYDEYTHIGDNISGTQYDVAHVKWGGGWRMPTLDEIQELVSSCTWEWGAYKGVNGIYVTGPNGNSIFLPAAGGNRYKVGSVGHYWSATLTDYYGEHIAYAYSLFFSDDDFYDDDNCLRESGYSVRAVTE